MSRDVYHPGLRGVVAGETEICLIDSGVQYRGYCLHDLAEGATFLEVAYLLLFDELPGEEHYADFLSIIAEEQELPPIIEDVFERLPVHNSPIEVLRTGICLLSHYDSHSHDDLLRAGHMQAVRLIARLPMLIGAWHRQRQGLPVLRPRPELSYVSNAYYLITGRTPSSLYERALEVALIVAAEHEFNPSTYVARIVGSTRPGQYSPIIAAIETFIGSEHGGGDDGPLNVLQAAGSPENVGNWYDGLASDVKIPGFGHPVHKEYDPRATILEVECERLAQAAGRCDLEKLADTIEQVVWSKRRSVPNVDWPLARLLAYLEFERDLFRPIFAMARLVGWSAHAVEQCETYGVIRPRARYRGARDCHFEPLRSRID